MRRGRTRAAATVSALVAAVLGGCTVGPDFHPPRMDAPAGWAAEPTDVGSRTDAGAIDAEWWRSFGDPELTSLVGRLLAQNLGLQEAAERVQQADAERQIARAQGLPQIEEDSSYAHERQSPKGFISLVQPAPFAPLTYDIWRNSLSASWELDLFGRVRRAVEAERADTVAAIEARHAIALDSVATLATDYIDLRGAEAREAIIRRNLDADRHALALVEAQFANGVSTTLAIADARALVLDTEATLPPLASDEARLIDAIGLLLAEPPRALEAELRATTATLLVPPVVPVGVPATLARRRPDVREAEARLHAATAETGVAVANLYPDISLSGMFDPNGRILGNAFSLPSRAFAVGPSIDIPIFKGGQLVATVRLRRSEQREAALAWRQTVLQAWNDVDAALAAYAEAERARAAIGSADAADRAALAAAEQSFGEGATDYLNVISAENTVLRSADDVAVADTAVETDLVGLYKALGGGWQAADPPAAANPAGHLRGS